MKTIKIILLTGLLSALPTVVEAINTSVINRAGGNNVRPVPQDAASQVLPPGLTATTAPDGTYRYGMPVMQSPLENPPKKTPLTLDIKSTVNGVASTTPIWNQTVALSSSYSGVSFSIVSGQGCTLSGANLTANGATSCFVRANNASGAASKPLSITFSTITPTGTSADGRFAYFNSPWSFAGQGTCNCCQNHPVLVTLVTSFKNKCTQLGPSWGLLAVNSPGTFSSQTAFNYGRTLFQSSIGANIVIDDSCRVITAAGSSVVTWGGTNWSGNGYVCFKSTP